MKTVLSPASLKRQRGKERLYRQWNADFTDTADLRGFLKKAEKPWTRKRRILKSDNRGSDEAKTFSRPLRSRRKGAKKGFIGNRTQILRMRLMCADYFERGILRGFLRVSVPPW